MKYFLFFSISFFAGFIAKAQSYNPAVQTWVISAETTPCESDPDKACLLYKATGKKEFEILQEPIEGFQYSEGNEYTIQVKQEIKKPPIAANESVFKYVLVKIVSQKQPTPAPSVTSTSSQIIFEVNFESLPCEEDPSKSCLLIRKKGAKEFEILNASIYGFNYENGYTYMIAVKPTSNGNYYLVNEISKKFVQKSAQTYTPLSNGNAENIKPVIGTTNITTSSTLDGKWYLRKMKEKEGASFVTDDNIMYIDINTFKDRIDGFGACNKFSAVIKSDLNTTFEVSKLTYNYVNCGNKKIEDLFFSLLQEANKFEVRNGHLILSYNWKYVLEFVADPNNKEDIASTYIPAAIIEKENKTFATDQYKKEPENKPSALVVKKPEVDDLQKQLEDLQKQLAEKKAKEEEALQKAAADQLQKEQEAALLKKQLAEKAAKEAEEKRLAEEKAKQEQEIAKKLKEIEDLKKQLAEKEKILTSNTTQKENYTSNNTSQANATKKVESVIEEKPAEKNVSPNYVITEFTPNNSNSNIPDPQFAGRPYYLDGNTLKNLERIDATYDMKIKGIYRGSEQYLTAFNPESTLQFKENNLPRIFIKITGEVDPYDIIDFSKAIEKNDRRRFKVGDRKLGGKAKDITENFIQLDFVQIRDGLYEIIIPSNLEVGEYGFLPILEGNNSLFSGSSSSSTKINCFGVAP